MMAPRKPKEKVFKEIAKPPYRNNLQQTGGPGVEPGDNAKYLAVNMVLFKMPNIDKRDVVQVQNRLDEYFQLYANNDMKPTVAGMAMALGWSRQQLWAVTHDKPLGGAGNYSTLPPEVTDCIKKSYFLMENMWETYMNSGKINPVSGIFLAKNNFGYRDQTEMVVTPNTQDANDFNAEDLKKRYLTDGGEVSADE